LLSEMSNMRIARSAAPTTSSMAASDSAMPLICL